MSLEKQTNLAFAVAMIFFTIFIVDIFAFLAGAIFGFDIFWMRVLIFGFFALMVATVFSLAIYTAFQEDLGAEQARKAKEQRERERQEAETCPSCTTRSLGHTSGTACTVCGSPF